MVNSPTRHSGGLRGSGGAAGLAISEGLRSQIGGLKVAVRNTQDGISVVQTAEGALTETHSILQRMRDLSVQAANSGGLNDDAKANLQSEIVQLKAELDRIANTTNFNGKKLLDGSFTSTFQVGANSGETISVNIATAMGSAGLGVDGVDVTDVGAYTFGAAAAAGVANISTAAADGTGAVMTITTKDAANEAPNADLEFFTRLTGTISFAGKSLDLGSIDYTNADGDNDPTTVPTAADALAVLNQAATDLWGLATDPFAVTATTLTFAVQDAVSGYTEAGGDPVGSAAGTPTAAQLSAATPTFTAASGASDAIDVLDDAINKVSTQRADLGAIQNRFDHTINNLNVAVENLTASESRIRDADMAQEMVQFTRNQILSQAGTAMLAQANSASQGILQLLR
ncbi:MAG TPA: flagellin [Pseudonocardiaceae bacterium]|nr:flagellin [Pseudonocardiaceae bacterium]